MVVLHESLCLFFFAVFSVFSSHLSVKCKVVLWEAYSVTDPSPSWSQAIIMSSQPHAILPKVAIRSDLHMLLIATNTTRASEVQDIKYIGDVSQWPNIEKDATASMSGR
jgi:hypothetical protein